MLRKLELKNFRNYDYLNLNFNSNIVIFLGDNAQGKTNILESIYVLGITKSHRNFKDENLIKSGCDFLRIKGTVMKDKDLSCLELTITPKGKSVKKNEYKIQKLSDYVLNLKVIMFCPDDLELIKGNPSFRRTYLNIGIAQLEPKYLFYLNKYNEFLKVRNNYLKKLNISQFDETYFNIITEELIKYAAKIYEYRFIFIKQINKKLDHIFEFITSAKKLQIEYVNNLNSLPGTDEYLIELKEKFKKHLSRELLLKQTLFGPHKDDFQFLLNDSNLKLYGSQSQQRAAVLSLKLSELDIYKETKKDYPILLLDDIFSEFDKKNRKKIIDYIDMNIQTFITATELDDMSNECETYFVKSGKITKHEEVKE